MKNCEQTLVLLKPDLCDRNLIGAVLSHYEQSDLTIEQMKMLRPSRELVISHYEEHQGRSYFEGLVNRLAEKSIVALVLSGEQAISRVREINGATDPALAKPGTIRARYALDMKHNSVHASDSPESSAREISLWFDKG